MQRKKRFQHLGEDILCLDFCLLALALFCSLFGLLLIYSATNSLEAGSERYVLIQCVAIGLGLIGFAVLSYVDIERFAPFWRIVYVLNLIFQLSLTLFGYEEGGNRSWLRFGGIGVQPAEIGKLLFIFTFAKHITTFRNTLSKPKHVLLLLVHVALIMTAIIVPSKDVGMSLSYLFIALVMLFVAGLQLRWFVGGAAATAAAMPLIWKLLSNVQRNRILVLFDPTIAPDTYWQQEQSRIAIGAGRVMGAGFLKGNQTQNNMLPEKQTDFIFGVAGEEWGLVGCAVILLALVLLIVRIFYIAYRTDSTFLMLLCVGVGSMFMFQTLENVFMCLGIGPVMGLTLPFFSYGGSSIVTMYLALGMVECVSWRYRRRKRDGLLTAGEITVDAAAVDDSADWKPVAFVRAKRADVPSISDESADETPFGEAIIDWDQQRQKNNGADHTVDTD